jgi:hypothetical protein
MTPVSEQRPPPPEEHPTVFYAHKGAIKRQTKADNRKIVLRVQP